MAQALFGGFLSCRTQEGWREYGHAHLASHSIAARALPGLGNSVRGLLYSANALSLNLV